MDAGARYTGVRYPFPARANRLEPFWTLDGGVRHHLAAGGWWLTPSVRVERLLDARASLIHGFPEPGRTVRFQLRASPDAPGRDPSP